MKSIIPHISDKIPILRIERDTQFKKCIRAIALQGPLAKYDIYKKTGIDTGNVSDVVDSLESKDYIKKYGFRDQEKRQESISCYSLTWKGLIACLYFEEIRISLIDILRKNPLLIIPVKEDSLDFLEKIYSPNKIQDISEEFFLNFVSVLPFNIELIPAENILFYTIPTLQKMDRTVLKNEKLSNENTMKFIASSDWITKLEKWSQEMATNIEMQVQQYKDLEKLISEIKKI